MSVVSRLQDQISQSFAGAPEPTEGTEAQRSHGVKVAISLTVVAFIFGALLAVQLRSVQAVRANRAEQAQSYELEKQKLKNVQILMKVEASNRAILQNRLTALQEKISKSEKLSQQQSKSLNQEIKKLQIAAGLAAVSGKGIVVKLSDNPNAAQDAIGAFLPGLVHDYDVLQAVNELRSAKADAIAVNGTRITGYTPIRCVGPVIYINWEPAAAPFVIEAIGDPSVLSSAMKMPGGILDNLKNQGLGVKIWKSSSLTLPPSKGLPTFKEAETVKPASKSN